MLAFAPPPPNPVLVRRPQPCPITLNPLLWHPCSTLPFLQAGLQVRELEADERGRQQEERQTFQDKRQTEQDEREEPRGWPGINPLPHL